MVFKGDELLLIVAKQCGSLQVMTDDCGKLERVFQNPQDALRLIAAGGYEGVGNRRYIRYIRPVGPDCDRINPWSTTEIASEIANQRLPHAEDGYGHHVQQTFGLKHWVTGISGTQKRPSEVRPGALRTVAARR